MYYLWSKFIEAIKPLTGEDVRLTVWEDLFIDEVIGYQLRWFVNDEVQTVTIRLTREHILTILSALDGYLPNLKEDAPLILAYFEAKREEVLMNYLLKEFTKQIELKKIKQSETTGENNNV